MITPSTRPGDDESAGDGFLRSRKSPAPPIQQRKFIDVTKKIFFDSQSYVNAKREEKTA